MSKCELCPRNCGADRDNGKVGICHETNEVYIARASLHMWEEPCISGTKGSGTVFFSGCPLGCVYCQNRRISGGETGVAVTVDELVQVYLKLQEMGANNINLVTPTHYVLQVAESLKKAKELGLCIPIVYNTSGYEKVKSLRLLDGLVDVYLPDFKYMSPSIAKKYSRAADYANHAKSALAEMFRQVGEPRFEFSKENDYDLMTRGMIVRHMILPGYVEDSKRIVEYLYSTFGDSIFLSIMNQYTPLENVVDFPDINRKVTVEEYDEVIDFAVSLGVENAFVQDGEAASESFIPDFENFDIKAFLSN